MRRPPHIVRLQVLRILAKEIDKVTEQLGELQTVRRERPVSACFVSSNLEIFFIFFLIIWSTLQPTTIAIEVELLQAYLHFLQVGNCFDLGRFRGAV